MAERSGICDYYGNCKEADSKRVISLSTNEEFKCPECGRSLLELKKDKGKKSPMMKIVAAVIVVIALLVIVGIFFFDKKEPATATKAPPPPIVAAPFPTNPPDAEIKPIPLPPATPKSPSVAGGSKKRQAPSEGKIKNVPDVVRGDQGDKDKSPSKGY